MAEKLCNLQKKDGGGGSARVDRGSLSNIVNSQKVVVTLGYRPKFVCFNSFGVSPLNVLYDETVSDTQWECWSVRSSTAAYYGKGNLNTQLDYSKLNITDTGFEYTEYSTTLHGTTANYFASRD